MKQKLRAEQGNLDIQVRNAVNTGFHTSRQAFEYLDKVTSEDRSLPKKGSDGTIFRKRKMLYIYPSNQSKIKVLIRRL